MSAENKNAPCCCKKSMVEVTPCQANLILFFNIILPGFGTLLSSCMDKKGCNCTAFWVAVAQFITFPILFAGYIWAIMHSCSIRKNAKS